MEIGYFHFLLRVLLIGSSREAMNNAHYNIGYITELIFINYTYIEVKRKMNTYIGLYAEQHLQFCMTTSRLNEAVQQYI